MRAHFGRHRRSIVATRHTRCFETRLALVVGCPNFLAASFAAVEIRGSPDFLHSSPAP